MKEVKNREWAIYMHTFPNDKKYIGVTVINENETPEQACLKRWRPDGSGYKTQRVGRAIKKYGWDNVKHEILFERVSEDEVDDLEISLIKKYNCQIDEGGGYNVDYGGKHRIVSDYTRKKLSEALSGENHPYYGTHRSEETKKRIGQAQIGKFISEETRKRISKAQTWQKGENNPRYGQHCTDETKEKIRKALKGKYTGENSYWYGKHLSDETRQKLSEKAKERFKDKTNHPSYGAKLTKEQCERISQRNSKPILVYDLFGNYIGEYKSASYYADLMGIGFSAVCNAAKFNVKTCENRLIIYKDEFTEEELKRRLDSFKETRKFAKYYYYNSAKLLFDKGFNRKDVADELGISWGLADACYKLMQEKVS
ncbi:MAG: NUMOD3 domain-containing DNA-binding protein [Bacilli bacterium]|nr:NUMOD3 domain-containing DNA-binding protein [Bacilli bacterium]